MARVLGRVRLSRVTDESTSEDRQRAAVEQWASSNGHTVVGWAVDMDVSGSVSPFEAPALGPWLTDRADEWDVLVAWKLDRVGRGLFDLNALFSYCHRNSKILATTDGKIDLTTAVGRLLASIIAGVAEMELELIQSRTQASQAELRKRGRFHGGTVPMGYKLAPADGGGWVLEVNEDEAPLVREMADRAARHESIRSIAERLNDQGVRARRGGKWTAQSVTRILRSRWIIGQAEHGGKTVLDEATGVPQQRTEPLISLSLWQEVQNVMDDRLRPKQRTNDTGVLLNIAHCGGCGEPLYHHVMVKAATDKRAAQSYRYWRCSGRTKKRNGCTVKAVPAQQLEDFTEAEMMRQIGDVERTKKEFIPAEGPGEQLAILDDAIATARKEKDLGLYDGDDAGYFARLTDLTERKNQLQAMPSRPAGWERRGLGETYKEAWSRMTPAERRELMLDAGVRVRNGRFGFELQVSNDALSAAVPGFVGESGMQRVRLQVDTSRMAK